MDVDINQEFNIHNYYQDQQIESIRKERFINSIMYKLRGKTLSYYEAAGIFHEIIIHMNPEEAHRLVYEMYNRVSPELSEICDERREYEAMPIYKKYPDGSIEIKYTDGNMVWRDKLTLGEMEKPKEDFLSKEDVIIK